MEQRTQQQIKAEVQELNWDIERYEEQLQEAEVRLYELQTEICKHPGLVRTGATWPQMDDCPDCGMMFYLANGKEETNPAMPDR